MRFELQSNKGKSVRETFAPDGGVVFPEPKGSTVGYGQPLLSHPLPSLPTAIAESGVLNNLAGRTYRLFSNHGYVQETLPAVEYYKFAYTRIRDNVHAIDICEQRITSLLREIDGHFRKNKELRPAGQYSISFEKEIYELRTEVTNLVFLSRAVLDLLSTLAQTIYGPSIGQYSSFNSFLKAALNKPEFPDDVLKQHLDSNIPWFYLLKDVRDYLAHYGALRFTLREYEGTLMVYAFHKKEVSFMVQSIHKGLVDFLAFLNTHWSEYVEMHNK